VFVDAQHGRTGRTAALGGQTPQEVLAVTLDSGRTDVFATAHPAAVDAITVIAEDLVAEGFRGSLRGQQSGKAFAKLPPAVPAPPAMSFQMQPHLFGCPTDMPYDALDPALIAQSLTLTVGQDLGPAYRAQIHTCPALC